MIKKFALIVFLGVLFSCGPPPILNEYISLENQEWHTDSLLKFEYFITDSIIKHKCILKIRHTVEYEFQNLYLFISSESNKDTVEVLMAEKNGRWVGKGIGSIREVEIILNTNKQKKG